MLKKIFHGDAYRIAHKFKPIIYQELKDIRDCLTPILLGDASRFSIIDQLKSPVAYFLAQEDETYYYFMFMLYHAYDYSNSPIKVVNKLDSHRHDTESVLLRVNKTNEKTDMCTVSHNSFKFARSTERKIFIEAATHAISPYEQVDIAKKSMVLVYNNYYLDNMGAYTQEELDKLQTEFNTYGVNMPSQMCDFILKAQAEGMNSIHTHKEGDIFYHPDTLFTTAERFNRF